jgi:hypothetical protein
VVEVLALEVDVRSAVVEREFAGVVDRRGPALEMPADRAQLGDEGGVVRDAVVGFDDFREGLFELGRQVFSAVFAEEAVLVGTAQPLVLFRHLTPR